MVRAWTLLLLVPALCNVARPEPADLPLTPSEVFARVRENVFKHLRQSVNYTCTEIVDRSQSYALTKGRLFANSCSTPQTRAVLQPLSRDRLRLDVAVSNNDEIFSWHGGRQFSSEGLDSLVKNGSVSTGSFIGYLHNVFGRPGVTVNYAGRVQVNGHSQLLFEFNVPLASSRFLLGHAKVLTPFHGSFTVDASNFELLTLKIAIEHAPELSRVCSANMTIEYQVTNISNEPTLIPRSYLLAMEMPSHLSSVSRTEFASCHAFRGESTIHYESTEDAQPIVVPSPLDPILPKSIRIYASINTPINNRDSYTGDPVEATLVKPFKVKDSQVAFTRGAKLTGVITQLEFFYEPVPHYLLNIRLDRISDSHRSFRMDTALEPAATRDMVVAHLMRLSVQQSYPNATAIEAPIIFIGKEFSSRPGTYATWVTLASNGE